MIEAVIFSKNRAARLDLCLSSLLLNCNIFKKIIVIYDYYEQDEYSYRKLISDYRDCKHIIFRREVLKLNEEFVYACNNLENPYVSFITDDTVFYRYCDIQAEDIVKVFDGKTMTFSLRLGLNTIIQDYRTGEEQQPLFNTVELDKDIIKWNYTKYYPLMNYGYPISLDGHIYERDEIQKLIECIAINNLRDFEGKLCLSQRDLYNRRKPNMCSLKHSVCVNIPVESSLGGLHHSNNLGTSTETELINYSKGMTLDLSSGDFSNIQGCHQEVRIGWRK